jgi:hypothetical protein
MQLRPRSYHYRDQQTGHLIIIRCWIIIAVFQQLVRRIAEDLIVMRLHNPLAEHFFIARAANETIGEHVIALRYM